MPWKLPSRTPRKSNALTREVRHADEALTAATLLEPETPAPVVTETRQFDSKLAELRASVDLEKHVKAALAGTIAQGGPEGEYNAELKIEAGWFPLDLLTRQARGTRPTRRRRRRLTSYVAGLPFRRDCRRPGRGVFPPRRLRRPHHPDFQRRPVWRSARRELRPSPRELSPWPFRK